MLKCLALCAALILFVIIVLAALRTIIEPGFRGVRKFDDATHHAYLFLIVAAAGLFAWSRYDLQFKSLGIWGVNFGELQAKVASLTDQMEVFYKTKRSEQFDKTNWDRVRNVGRSQGFPIMEVTLDDEPIPGSVEVYEGVLLMPQLKYRFDGRKVQFPTNSDKPDTGLTIIYYPRAVAHQH